MKSIILHLLFATVFYAVGVAPAFAAGQTVIRDAEIETMLKEWTRPVIDAAGLSPDAVHLVLIQSPDVNAFVAGGQNIFLYTGLIDQTDNAGEVVGVVAHELGHIAGGHLVRGAEASGMASYEMMAATILGLGVAVATGSGNAATAIAGAGAQFAQRGILAFSRTQESSADQAGLRFMKTAEINPTGLVTFMQKLADQELLPSSQQNEFVRTHPISSDRVDYLTSSLGESPLKDKPIPSKWADQYARMKAKLVGYITPQQVMWLYPDKDKSIYADYARAVSAYRQNNVTDALKRADALIAREPQNPYFYELKGQMLFDFGRVDNSVAPYARATELAPDQPLIRLSYAQAISQSTGATKDDYKHAIDLLNFVVAEEPRNPRAYRLLGTDYGLMGDTGQAQAMLAEEAFLQGRYDQSRMLAKGALHDLPDDSRARSRVLDLMVQLDRVMKDKRD